MDHTVIVAAIGKHLDSLEKITSWALLVSLAVALAGLQGNDNIPIAGITFARKWAFNGTVGIYLFANLAITMLFLRIGELLLLVQGDKFGDAFATVATHSWIMNPYAYFGSGAVARSHSCEGYAMLIVLWWLCHSSLSTLIEGRPHINHKVLVVLFLGLGLVAMWSVQRVYFIVLERGAATLPSSLYEAVLNTSVERTIATFLGVGMGGLVYRVFQSIKLGAAATAAPGGTSDSAN